jgi:AraC family transcriptional regulator
MIPTIKNLPEKKLVGKSLEMSLVNNKTVELWRSFMQKRHDIRNNIGTDLYSMQVYDEHHFKNFSPQNVFEKWAMIEVSDFDNVPNEMKTFTLESGLYAVFHYKGDQSKATETFQYIFGVWLPNSAYLLDNRPHFELLGQKYKNNDPDSEEEIWIPVKVRPNTI